MFRPRIQQTQILAGTLTREIDLNRGSEYPENVWVVLSFSAMSAGETLDITGRRPGQATYQTAVLVTQIDANAAASTVTATNLSAVGPLDKIKLVAANIAAAETIDITVISW